MSKYNIDFNMIFISGIKNYFEIIFPMTWTTYYKNLNFVGVFSFLKKDKVYPVKYDN